MEKIPVSIVTGFLGSGKTTLLSRLLDSGELQNAAFIINEFGEIGIDNLLVKSSVENTLLLENGCVCCSIRGDLSDTISGLFSQVENQDIPYFDIILIETTGLAQPGPIVQTVQTDLFDNSPGSTTQIKECTSILIKLAKSIGLPILIVGHITKDGNIAGPKILEHMVDTVLHFEGDKQHQFRILRSKKNRFGSTNEIGIYEMDQSGLKTVANPSELFVSKKQNTEPGSAIAVTLDGDRSIMIEIQALVSSAVYGTPQRISNGFNSKRLNMLLAILEKKAGFKIGVKDVFINITGGIKIEDTAIDLAVVSAILSSNINVSVTSGTCFCAEIDLSGELRSVSNIDKRISEAERLGYKKIIVSNNSKIGYTPKLIQTVKLKNLSQVVKEIFTEKD